jgi:hypothetical protein
MFVQARGPKVGSSARPQGSPGVANGGAPEPEQQWPQAQAAGQSGARGPDDCPAWDPAIDLVLHLRGQVG